MLNIIKIKDKMLANKISEEAIAEFCGVSPEVFHSWLTGQNYPRLSNLVLMSRMLKVPLVTLLNEPTPFSESSSDKGVLAQLTMAQS